ncbi:acyl-CoA reductase [Lysinibacillus xylanilyticus]|uniref:acyl-CoA reductase n=1 Tax=Lysinibacillus xylanilyticus TaxID=582475 RepID=UPI002B242013|nr:acyl-CoA reductase [Lysinibacillus xylanilyticus]MEB2298491.1 acyl-CoA reductase [Lysinibacillus xylanilyticus]
MMKLFWPKNLEFEVAIEQLSSNKPNQPFDLEVVAFTQALSKRFLRMRELPEVVALGYWLRKANIKEMQTAFERDTSDRIVRSRGTVFHIAPSNVDTIFVYSWMLSLLAGNRNVIRISSKEQNGLNVLLQITIEELARNEFQKIAKQTIICTYGHEENATAEISAACQTRVIWGGDETISAIREIPLTPLANELAFPDRFSLAVLNSEVISKLDEALLDSLLEQFYNDVFWFDQMACSSPRLITWCGENQQAINRFWSAFEHKIQQKQYELMAATQVLKYTTTLMLATESNVENLKNGTYFSRVKLSDIPVDVRERHCGGGLFYEYKVDKLEELADILIDKDQTITYFGFKREELESLVEAISTRGIDRVVPIGKALDFNGVWDGQSFLTSFTREVVII